MWLFSVRIGFFDYYMNKLLVGQLTWKQICYEVCFSCSCSLFASSQTQMWWQTKIWEHKPLSIRWTQSLAIVVKTTLKKKKKWNVALGKFRPEFPFIVYSTLRGYLIPRASELIHLMFHCYETRVKIKTSCLPFQFYVPVYWYLITTLGQVQHTKTQSK